MKLIRDNLKITDQETFIVLDPQKYQIFLRKKLDEELYELSSSNYKNLEEYADVIEVLYALLNTNTNYSIEDLESTRKYKLDVKGGFSKGIILGDKKL